MGGISIEVFTIGDYFSLCVMQPGRNDVFVNEVIRAFDSCGIECWLTGEERYQLPDYVIDHSFGEYV